MYNNELSSLVLQGQIDSSTSPDLRQVADGCALRVKSYTAYDVNGYRFHTKSHEVSHPIEEPQILEFV
jgi:hypothetical protein